MKIAIPAISLASVLEAIDLKLNDLATPTPGARESLPITPEMRLIAPSGNLFGLSLNIGPGTSLAHVGRIQGSCSRCRRLGSMIAGAGPQLTGEA
jgi:hypothetical protein